MQVLKFLQILKFASTQNAGGKVLHWVIRALALYMNLPNVHEQPGQFIVIFPETTHSALNTEGFIGYQKKKLAYISVTNENHLFIQITFLYSNSATL